MNPHRPYAFNQSIDSLPNEAQAKPLLASMPVELLLFLYVFIIPQCQNHNNVKAAIFSA